MHSQLYVHIVHLGHQVDGTNGFAKKQTDIFLLILFMATVEEMFSYSLLTLYLHTNYNVVAKYD